MSESREPQGTDEMAAGILAFMILGGGSGLAVFLVCKFAYQLDGPGIIAAAIALGLIAGTIGAFTKFGRTAGWVILEVLYVIGLFS
jgi:hypothetical protein